MTIRLHAGDLPADHNLGPIVAIDTETLGLEVGRDRLCLVQLSRGDGSADLVQVAPGQKRAPNLEKLLANPKVLKLFHFGRFDIAMLWNAFGALASPVYCTKIASKLTRTYTDRHGLKDLVRELLGVAVRFGARHDVRRSFQARREGVQGIAAINQECSNLIQSIAP